MGGREGGGVLVVIEVDFSSSLQAVNLEQKQQFQDYLLKFTTLVAAKNHLIMKEAGELSHPQSGHYLVIIIR